MLVADLVPGTRVDGIFPVGAATVLAVRPVGEAIRVTVEDDDGNPSSHVLFPDDVARLRFAERYLRWSFDADGASFRLAAEALRMRLAALSDPMLAVSTSAVDPLPHQIQAVYQVLLPMPGALRYLLADDPGAGKTIMAGLYLKELMLRGDVQRALIIAPGGLVEQWHAELQEKFDLDVPILSRAMAEADAQGDPFRANRLLIARMDQLSRNEEWRAHLARSQWDLIVVDEAHRMSAHYWQGELETTGRYRLGQLLSGITRHLLLMTATPHAGKEADYQAFLALLDPDRFDGEYREGAHSTDTTGIMRRMVKEDLLTYEGKRLFPLREAHTVAYQLTDDEMELYEQVSEYVRTEMNRAEAIADPSGARRRTVGFALTVLQRRLASSPEAIYQSLRRRSARLRRRRQEILDGTARASDNFVPRDFDADEYDAASLEAMEEEFLDAATAASTVAELDVELGVLARLEVLALAVLQAGEDRKWTELRALVLEAARPDADGAPQKLIVFSEHRDTLRYLVQRLGLLIRSDAVVAIDGSTSRQARKAITARFTSDPTCQVLVATDAAGEGLNLQAAHLMVNYDLPWNPNRIEQRFGRIHRIGQKHLCTLWNLVATQTREGQVFARLLGKIDEQRKAYGGKVFNVLGERAFTETPLRDLLLEAIRHGNQPEVRAYLDQVIDATVTASAAELLAEHALATPPIDPTCVAEMRRQRDEAVARKLQPFYIQLFVLNALRTLGARCAKREGQRFEITHLPAAIHTAHPLVAPRYARITFDPTATESLTSAGEPGRPAELISPGHPLMDALIDAVLARFGDTLTRGATFTSDDASEPALAVAVVEEVQDGDGHPLSKRFDWVNIDPGRVARLAGPAPYLDVQPLDAEPAGLASELPEVWTGQSVEQVAEACSIEHGLPAHRAEIQARVTAQTERTRRLVERRLTAQANYWHTQAVQLAEDQRSGRKTKITPATARERANNIDARMERRLAEIDRQSHLSVLPPRVTAAYLLLPAPTTPESNETYNADPADRAVDTTITDRIGVDAVLAAERALGRSPVEQHHSNPGFDIRSETPEGQGVLIEVKSHYRGASDYEVRFQQVLCGKNSDGKEGNPDYRLALVTIDPETDATEVRYLHRPFDKITLDAYTGSITRRWAKDWARGRPPF